MINLNDLKNFELKMSTQYEDDSTIIRVSLLYNNVEICSDSIIIKEA